MTSAGGMALRVAMYMNKEETDNNKKEKEKKRHRRVRAAEETALHVFFIPPISLL